MTQISGCLLSMGLMSIAALPARAQLAVVDAPAIAQLVQQVKTMEQQVQTAENQLAQAQQALQTMTGDRGMELLLGGTLRNYLPSNWTQLTSSLQGAGGAFSALSSGVQSAIATNAILTPQQLSTLSALQTLISAIATATDQKAILDLQARISAELAMLQNEQTKLLILNQATQAEQAVHAQQEREQSVADHGSFASRFQPAPAAPTAPLP
jgi:type IV secretion system protein VirB5